MAVDVYTPVVLAIDIVLADVTPGETVLEIPNPEAHELIVTRSLLRRITADTTGADERASLDVYTGVTLHYGFTVEGGIASTETALNSSAFVWPGGESLNLSLREGEGFEAAETFVGKLYVEYFSSQSEEYGRAANMMRYYRHRRIPILPRLG